MAAVITMPPTTVVIRNSWMEYNSATQDGGGIYHATGLMTVTVNARKRRYPSLQQHRYSRRGPFLTLAAACWLTGNDNGDTLWLNPGSTYLSAGFSSNSASQRASGHLQPEPALHDR